MDKIIVGIAEGKVARENQVLISYALGSCVGVCLYDPRERIAGMAHIILPEGSIQSIGITPTSLPMRAYMS